MTISCRSGAVGAGLAVVILLGSLPLGAQEPGPARSAKKSGAPTVKRTRAPSRRVPAYFGQIGLSPEQRESIYQIQSKHQALIDTLKKQINDIQAQMLTECESVLNE